MRLVLDTNIIISALINPRGRPSQIIKMILTRKAELCYNSAILSEYEKVAMRPKFSKLIDSKKVHRFFILLKSIGIPFDPIPSSIKLPDESDRVFYDTAKGSGSILITGNIKHFPKESFVMTTAEFLEFFREKTKH